MDPKVFIPSLLIATSNAMGYAEVKFLKFCTLTYKIIILLFQLEFSEDWKVSSNLYAVLIAEKGAGKTPTTKVFMDPLTALEKEECEEFDRAQHLKRKTKTTPRRSKKTSLSVESGEEYDEQDEAENEEEQDSESSWNSSSFTFHPKTRIIDQITSEALILALSKGSGEFGR